MNCKELIEQLREMLPQKVDYAEMVGAEAVHYGKSFVYEDPESYIIELAADTIAALLAEREAAVEDLHRMHTLCMDIGECCPECGNQIDELMDAACSFCKGPGVSCWKDDPKDGRRCAAFEWRGPTPSDGPKESERG